MSTQPTRIVVMEYPVCLISNVNQAGALTTWLMAGTLAVDLMIVPLLLSIIMAAVSECNVTTALNAYLVHVLAATA